MEYRILKRNEIIKNQIVVLELKLDNFLFSNWEACYWYGIPSLENTFEDNRTNLEKRKLFSEGLLGYCLGEKLSVRPRDDSVALMYAIGKDEFWFHMDKEAFLIKTCMGKVVMIFKKYYLQRGK
jgi:hypothetical protein